MSRVVVVCLHRWEGLYVDGCLMEEATFIGLDDVLPLAPEDVTLGEIKTEERNDLVPYFKEHGALPPQYVEPQGVF